MLNGSDGEVRWIKIKKTEKKSLSLVSFHPPSICSLHANLSRFQKQLSGGGRKAQTGSKCALRLLRSSQKSKYCDRNLLFPWKDQNLKSGIFGMKISEVAFEKGKRRRRLTLG